MKFPDWIALLNVIFTGGLLGGVWLAYVQIKSDHEHRRREYVMHLYDIWREILDLGKSRRCLEKIRTNEITHNDLQLIADSKPIPGKLALNEVYELRKQIISVLNLFEQVAVAYRENIGNRKMIKNYFRESILKSRSLLDGFVNQCRRDHYRGAWEALDEVVKTWRADDGPVPPEL